MVKNENPQVRYYINNATKINKGAFIYLHPLKDKFIDSMNKNTSSFNYAIGSEEIIAQILVNMFVPKDNIPSNLLIELDSAILQKVGLPEDFKTKVDKALEKKSKFSIVVGSDLYRHNCSTNIAKLIALLEKYASFIVLIIPSQTNSLGVSLLNDLDNAIGKYSIGYNEDGDFMLKSFGDENENTLYIPAPTQQEGTITTIDKRVVTMNQAMSYDG
jgi:NADH-quinone oxidoreductase subunit G